MVRYLLFGFLFVHVACSSKGFDRGELRNQLGVTKPQFDDKDIKAAYQKKPNLPKPFRIAIYFKNPRVIGQTNHWRWTEQDKSRFDEVSQQLILDKTVSAVFPLSNSLTEGEWEMEDLRSLRLLAAKHQADALLVVGGVAEVDRYINSWGWSYTFILPTFFVKGSQADTLFLASAALWDVKNEYLYLAADSEEIVNTKYAAALGASDKELIEEAKKKSLAKLALHFQQMVRADKAL